MCDLPFDGDDELPRPFEGPVWMRRPFTARTRGDRSEPAHTTVALAVAKPFRATLALPATPTLHRADARWRPRSKACRPSGRKKRAAAFNGARGLPRVEAFTASRAPLLSPLRRR